MASAFGFSAGDFVTAIELIVRISKALREIGGASDECSVVIQDLQILRQSFDFLQQIRPTEGDLSRINAIRTLAITCTKPLKEFSEKIERSYGTLSSSRSSRHLWSHAGRKVQWSLFAAEDISKFRSFITGKIVVIGLLLGAFNYESTSRIELQNTDTKTCLLAKVAECRDTLQKNLSDSETRDRQAFSAVIGGTGREITSSLFQLKQTTDTRHELLVQKADLHTRTVEHLGSRTDALKIDTCAKMRKIIGLCLDSKAANEQAFRTVSNTSQRLEDTMDSLHREQSRTNFQIRSSHTSLLSQLRSIRAIGASLLKILIPYSDKVLLYLRENVKNNLEIYALLLRIQQGLPKQLGASDTIYFEDALGRTEDLPYIYFRHWEVFESMLRCHFKGLPGEEKVLHGDYHLINGGLIGVRFDKSHWHETVFPGTKLRMSMIMQNLYADRGICPRLRCNGKTRTNENSNIIHCLVCGLNLAPAIPAFSCQHQLREIDKATLLLDNELSTMPGNAVGGADTRLPRKSRMKRKLPTKLCEQLDLQFSEYGERERQEMMSFRMVHICLDQHPVVKTVGKRSDCYPIGGFPVVFQARPRV